jgi:hypothetical protein
MGLHRVAVSCAFAPQGNPKVTSEVQQHRQLQTLRRPVSGLARIAAVEVTVEPHQDADAFVASPDRLLDLCSAPETPPAVEADPRGVASNVRPSW